MYFKTVGRKSKAGNAESAERVEERRSETKSYKHRFTTIDTSILSIYMSIEFADFFEENDLFVKYVYVKSVSYIEKCYIDKKWIILEKYEIISGT